MQNIQNQQNFCTFQQPSILSTYRALRTIEGYSSSTCGSGCTSYADMTCPSGWTKFTQDKTGQDSVMCISEPIKGGSVTPTASICGHTPDTATYKKCKSTEIKYCCPESK